MRALLLTMVSCCLSACADQPTKVAAVPAASAAQPAQSAADAEADKKRLAEAIKHGYKVVSTNGENLYCRSDWATGSHIQKNTVCLTAQQLDDLGVRNDRDYSIPSRSPVSSLP